jgi:hypothetical protein
LNNAYSKLYRASQSKLTICLYLRHLNNTFGVASRGGR